MRGWTKTAKGRDPATETLRDWAIVATVALIVFGFLLLLVTMAGYASPGFTLTAFLVEVLIFAILAQGLNIQFGFTGLINFGHVAFYALGAYGVALFSRRVPACRPVDATSFPWWIDWVCGEGTHLVWINSPLAGSAGAFAIGIFVAVLAAGFFAILLGVPTLRLREDYLAIVTIGAAEILRLTLNNEQWMGGGNPGEFRGGAQGIRGISKPWSGSVHHFDTLKEHLFFGSTNGYHLILLLIALALLLGVMVVVSLLVNSPWGRVLKAIREDEDVASALGKNVFRFKIQALVLGALIAAFGGAVWAWFAGAVSPKSFEPEVTFYAWIAVIVGGAGNLRGPLVGAFILRGIFQAARLFPDALPVPVASFPLVAWLTDGAGQVFLIGLLLVIVMVFRPQGILGKREEMILAK